MENFGKNWLIRSISVGALMLFGSLCFASENVIYVINNNSPQYGYGYGGYRHNGNVMCTLNGGICVNSGYMMSTASVRYAPTQWKRPTIRERRLSSNGQNAVYYR